MECNIYHFSCYQSDRVANSNLNWHVLEEESFQEYTDYGKGSIILVQHLHFTYGETDAQREIFVYSESLKWAVRNIFCLGPLASSFVWHNTRDFRVRNQYTWNPTLFFCESTSWDRSALQAGLRSELWWDMCLSTDNLYNPKKSYRVKNWVSGSPGKP